MGQWAAGVPTDRASHSRSVAEATHTATMDGGWVNLGADALPADLGQGLVPPRPHTHAWRGFLRPSALQPAATDCVREKSRFHGT